jgi:hypothetical protein
MQQTVSVGVAPVFFKDSRPKVAAGNPPVSAISPARDHVSIERVAPRLIGVADAYLGPQLIEARLRRDSYADRSFPIVAPLALLFLFVVAWLV